MKLIISLVLVFYALGTFAQVIPQSRQVNWTDALLSYGFVVPVTEIDVTDFGATGDGITNDQPAVMAAIASLNGNLGYIYFPPGNYLLRGSLNLPDSAILKGFSSNFSVLKFNFSGTSQDCIIMAGTSLSVFVRIDGGYAKDNSWILTDSAFLFNTNDYVEIVEENGTWDVNPATWAGRSVGQIVQVSYRHDDTLFLESPLRITYDPVLNPRLRKIDPRVNAGVECLKITRIDESTSLGNPLTTNDQHIIGNDITSSIGSYIITGTSHIQHGNNHFGTNPANFPAYAVICKYKFL